MPDILLSPRFQRSFSRLPENIRSLAKKKIQLFKENPRNNNLRFHKLKGGLSCYHSFSVSQSYRIITRITSSGKVILTDIGNHSLYG